MRLTPNSRMTFRECGFDAPHKRDYNAVKLITQPFGPALPIVVHFNGDAMSKTNLHANRPLSPHLQVYKMTPTMAISIIHRITGGALYFGTLLIAAWLIAAATSESAFNTVNAVYSSWFGKLVLFGYTWALVHHMAGGVRHLFWDMGKGFEKHTATKSAWAVVIASVALTILIWAGALVLKGGF